MQRPTRFSYLRDMTIDSHIWTSMKHSVQTYPAKAVLLEAGRCATKVFVVKSGLLRMWFDQDGREVTMQFFLEGSPVCSVESFIKGTPSEFNIGTVGPCELLVIDKKDVFDYINLHPEIKETILSFSIDRMLHYSRLFLSRIKYSPEQRYKELLQQHPEILRRVPQHYIASYLGITSVSLSRIRSRSRE